MVMGNGERRSGEHCLQVYEKNGRGDAEAGGKLQCHADTENLRTTGAR